MEKIYFEKYKSSDFNEYFNLVQDDDVMKYISGKGLTKEQANHKFNSILDKSYIDDDLGYFKVYTENKTLVGECKLVQNNYLENSLELGYILKKDFWQQGIGSQICEHLLSVSKDKFPTYEVIALINPDNVASRKLLEKFNFESYWKGFENELFTEKFILKK